MVAEPGAGGRPRARGVPARVSREKDYVPSAKFTTWMFRIATNLAFNSVRDNRYQKLEGSMDAPVVVDAQDGDEKVLDVADNARTSSSIWSRTRE